MKSATISEAFEQAVGERRVTNAFFSTFSVEPDFFELYIIPLFLDGAELSTDETIRHAQLQHHMGHERVCFAVAHDFDVVHFECTPRLEVDYLPVRVAGACQHAKIAVLEVVDSEGRVAIILAAGSFNLTRAGWWQNIEVGHWVELSVNHAPRNVVRPLRDALDFFGGNAHAAAITALIKRLDSWKEGPADADCEFYFSGAGAKRRSVPDLLRNVSRDYVDIVSPFFSEDGNNQKMAKFLAGFERVQLLVPKKNNVPTMTEAVYTALKQSARWCQWHQDMLGKERGFGDRILHAKIFAGDSWRFVGSVNLSYKALYENVEAGFLLTNTPRLKLLGKEADEHVFSEVNESEEGSQEVEAVMPPLSLSFDWHDRTLRAISPESGTLTLFNQEGVAYPVCPLERHEASTLNIEGLDLQLKHSALIKAYWTNPHGATSQVRNLIVSQHQVYCRPTSLPEMDVRDLLRIFQGMKPAARAALIAQLAAAQARAGAGPTVTSNEFLPALPSDQQQTSFFSEFSQVNGAFWNLKQKLKHAELNGRTDELNYYLAGEQPDSLRGLARALASEAQTASVSTIVRYVTLLSMDEILANHAGADDALRGQVRALIGALEDGDAFNAMDDKLRFLAWIKEMFSKPLKRNHVGQSTQEAVNE
ncbi:MAG: phospholipase D-like domain-containing protein [Pseudomonadota bacterium]